MITPAFKTSSLKRSNDLCASHRFSGINTELWTHRVGGYQVLEKWLKDRKGRELSFDDITHYTRVCAALERTRTAMLEIDNAIALAGGFPIV